MGEPTFAVRSSDLTLRGAIRTHTLELIAGKLLRQGAIPLSEIEAAARQLPASAFEDWG
jgi:hypothetical protein